MNNVEFSLYLKAAKDILRLIEIGCEDGGLPFKIRTIYKSIDGEIQLVDESKLDLWFFRDIKGWEENYGSLESVRSLIKYLAEETEVWRKVTKVDGFISSNEERQLKTLLHVSYGLIVFPIVEMIGVSKSTELSDELIRDTYKKYRNSWSAPLREYKINSPLLAFESDIDEFVFSDEFSITRFTDAHKNECLYRNSFESVNSYSREEIATSTHMIQWRKTLPQSNPRETNVQRESLYLLILALRLCNSSDVLVKESFDEPRNNLSIIASNGVWHFETSKPSMFTGKYLFGQSDLEKAKGVFSRLMKLKGVKGYKSIFTVITNRYLSSLSRITPEDSIIDLTICLESLLLADERDELKYRLSLRGAVLLGGDAKGVKKTLGKMYNDRSRIVHSGQTLLEIHKDSHSHKLAEYRMITDEIILKYISLSESFDGLVAINEKLDDLCLVGGDPQP